jgi:hypothetical protein
MKKVLTILIAAIFLASSLQLSIDRHYCGGYLAAVKVSLTGEKASCGMKVAVEDYSNQLSINTKCCEDQMFLLSLKSNYCPEYLQINKIIPHIQKMVFQNILLSESQLINLNVFLSVLPPGKISQNRLNQPDICVFRI